MLRTLRGLAVLMTAAVLNAPLFAAEETSSSGSEPPSPFLPYAVAALSTLLILFTVCKPSKKNVYED